MDISYITVQQSSSSTVDGLRSQRDCQKFYIDWWLTNHCNYNCSYCHEVLKSSSVPMIPVQDARQFVTDVSAYARSIGKIPDYNITGGEVTLWPALNELLELIKTLGGRTRIRTNASQTVSEFAETIKLLDSIQIDYHPEHAQLSHFMLCLNRALDQESLEITVNFNMIPEQWSGISELADRIKDKWPSAAVNKRMLFDDPVINTRPKDYGSQQLEELKTQNYDLMLSINGQDQPTNYESLILEKRNRFSGLHCHAGVEQIIVDAWGTVHRGHCRMGGSLGVIGGAINFTQTPIVCRKDYCANSFDIRSTKIRSSPQP